MASDRYGIDVLSSDGPSPRRVQQVAATGGLVVECAATGWCGAIVGWQKGADGWAVLLEDRRGRRRPFAVAGSFLVDGELVSLRRPVAVAAPDEYRKTASGSVAAAAARAHVARASRIWVEGRQDAELIERVWGEDLRAIGVVVEELGGVDLLPARMREVEPGDDRRVGALVDHLVPGSKETRIAQAVMAEWPGACLVLGHPYVDVWQAIRPEVLQIPAWPVIAPGTSWKDGVCAALGWPADTGSAWRGILSKVSSYADLEPSLLGRVEELIDFVAAPHR